MGEFLAITENGNMFRLKADYKKEAEILASMIARQFGTEVTSVSELMELRVREPTKVGGSRMLPLPAKWLDGAEKVRVEVFEDVIIVRREE